MVTQNVGVSVRNGFSDEGGIQVLGLGSIQSAPVPGFLERLN